MLLRQSDIRVPILGVLVATSSLLCSTEHHSSWTSGPYRHHQLLTICLSRQSEALSAHSHNVGAQRSTTSTLWLLRRTKLRAVGILKRRFNHRRRVWSTPIQWQLWQNGLNQEHSRTTRQRNAFSYLLSGKGYLHNPAFAQVLYTPLDHLSHAHDGEPILLGARKHRES